MPIEPNDLEAWKRAGESPNFDPIYELRLGRDRLRVIVGEKPAHPVMSPMVSVSRSWLGRTALPTPEHVSLVKASFDLTSWTEMGHTRHVAYLVPPDATDAGKKMLCSALRIVSQTRGATDAD